MKYIHSLYIGLLSLLFIGCQEEQLNNMQTGGFLISLNDDVSTEVTTKSTPAELGEPATENFKLKIVNETTNNLLYDGAYKSGTIPASAGTYTVTASFGDNSLVALDEPYYKGEQPGVVVEEGKTTSVLLACKVANALASVIFPDATEMAKIYESYWVKVAVENYNVKLKPNSTNSAYFQVGKEVSFYFEGEKLNGQSVSAKLEHDDLPTTFEAADHYTLRLTFNDDLTLDISKVEATTVKINETIPMEWLPKPKVEAEGFEGNELSFVETENKTASIKLVTALQDLKLKFNFKDEQFISSLPKEEYVLSNPEDKQAIETALGITLPEIGTTDASLDLSPLLAKLQTNAGETTKNSIEIDAKANNRWSSEEIEGQETPNLKYTLTCEKPEFSVSIQKENCWSREFTIDEVTVTSGNVDIIKNNLVYQYYNGQEWLDCATRENIKGRTQQFTEAAEDLTTKEYKVRALYRGAIASSEATATLETPTQLPNSNLDEWSYTESSSNNKGNEGSLFNSRYTYIPIYKLTSSFWSTNNDYTTRYNNRTFGRPYNCFPAVSYVPGRLGGKAAELRNTASGAGNTNAGSISVIDDRNKVAGILFTGDFECESGGSATNYSYTKTNGKEFESRPTSLKFWYKYLPYTSDTWQAHIELWDKDKNIIIQQDFQSSLQKTDYEEVEIKLDYNNQQSYPVCKYIYIIFQSTITEGENMPFEKFKDTYVLWKDEQQYTYNELHVGSILTIDDISLVYDK